MLLQKRKDWIINAPYLFSLNFYCPAWHHMAQIFPLVQLCPLQPLTQPQPVSLRWETVENQPGCCASSAWSKPLVCHQYLCSYQNTAQHWQESFPSTAMGKGNSTPARLNAQLHFETYFFTYLLIHWIFITLPRYWNIALYQIKCPGDV